MKTNLNKSKFHLIQISFVVLFLNTIIESFLLISEDRTLIISAQLLLNGLYFIYFFLFSSKIKRSKLNGILTFIIIYFILLACFSSDLITTFNYLSKFLIPLIYLIIGYNIISNGIHIDYFLNKTWYFLAYFCIYIIIVNVLGIGEELYLGGIKTGYFSLNGLYVPCFSSLVVLYNLNAFKNKLIKFLSLIFTICTIIILLILLKRTLLIIIIIGILLYIIKNFSIGKLVKIVVFTGVVAFVIFYFYTNNIISGFESRRSRFTEEYDFRQEGRFTENYNIYNFMKNTPIQLLVGTGEVFNDKKFISEFYEKEREAHNSFIRIFWSGGLLGLLFFILLYIKQFTELLSYFRLSKFHTSKSIHNFFYFMIIFVFLRLINDFSSGITYLGYNAYSYFIIGGALRYGHEFKISMKQNITKNAIKRNSIMNNPRAEPRGIK